MWWILALVGLGAFLVLIAAAAWFLLRSRPKPAVEEEDPDFAPRETPARLAPAPADPAWSADEFKPVALPPPVVRPDAEPAYADGAGAYAAPAVERAAEDGLSAGALTDGYAPAGGAEAAPVAEAVPVAPVHAEAEPAVEAAAFEAPVVEAAAFEAPVVEAAPPVRAEPEPAPEEPPVFDMIQKARIAGEDLVLRAHAVRFQDEDLLGFVTEGFGGHGKPDFALYMPMPEGDPIEVIKAGLKFFSFVSLKLQERATPVVADDVLLFPGQIGSLNFGGFLAVAPNEPVAVPMGSHVVLLAVPKSRIGTDPAALRALLAPSGVLPYRSEPGA